MLRNFPVRIKPVLAMLLIAAFSIGVSAEDTLAARAQAVLDKNVAAFGLPAITAGIVQNGKIAWVGAAGVMDIENKVPANTEMVHRLASVSKLITATGAMQLVENGKLNLDAPVRTYVPSWPQKAEGEILMRHLLSQTSGIRHYVGRENRPMDHYATLLDAVNLFKDRPLAFAPGDQFLYTTYGYTLVGAAMEAASAEKYADYMRKHVWEPAGMAHTTLEVGGVDTPNKAKLYRRSASGPIPDDYDDASVRYPGGGIQSTAGDLLRFAIAFEDGKLISKASIDRMQVVPEVSAPPPDRRLKYGIGCVVYDSKDFGRFIAHDGGQSGASTNLALYLDKHAAVAVLCNLQNASQPVLQTTIALARIALGLPDPARAQN